MEHWRVETDRNEWKFFERNLINCLSGHHKTHTGYPRKNTNLTGKGQAKMH
jgi:hypothetical protein